MNDCSQWETTKKERTMHQENRKMKDILVGYTGFVGGNIAAKHQFEGLYNSKNIKEAYNTNPDLMVYSGIRAEMFLANKFPEKDLASMDEAIENIKNINPKRLVLISTISVYDNPVGVDEDVIINEDKLTAYGKNRRYLEKWVMEHYQNCLIVRLPALYGEGIKKNFIYDMIHFIPSLLNETKYRELGAKDKFISEVYSIQDNGFYKCNVTDNEGLKRLKCHFEALGFSALNFTDSRSQYQFYNLAYLWQHIDVALQKGIRLLNPATEPVSISELSEYVLGKGFVNEVKENYPVQDYRCKNAETFGGKDGYLFTKEFVMRDIKNFINNRTL